MICAVFDPCEGALAVAMCESGLGTNANAYAEWNPNIGLFQLWEGHYRLGFDLYDDYENTLAAYRLSAGGTDWSRWACRP